MSWNVIFGLAVLAVVTWLVGKLSRERDLISAEDVDRVLLTTALLFLVALVSAAANALDAAVPALLSLLVTALVVSALLYIWLPRLGRAMMSPLTTAFDGGDEVEEAKPFYHRAAALRKQGKFQEALDEIRAQLERFPDDAEGMMLQAEVQSDDFKDLTAALGTLTAIVATPERPERDKVLAISRMADLHLRAEDTVAARRSLESIVQGWPGTDAARLALQRIHHLPGAEYLAAQRDPKRIVIGNYEKNLGLKSVADSTRDPALATPAQQASALLNRIVKAPEDWETREQLAILYARHFKRFDLAKDQLEVLIGSPNPPDKAVVHWLNLLADLQLDAPDGVAQARATLQRVVERFPKTPWAEMAASRVSRLGLETKAREETKTIKLGTYEQNIGLKLKIKPVEPDEAEDASAPTKG